MEALEEKVEDIIKLKKEFLSLLKKYKIMVKNGSQRVARENVPEATLSANRLRVSFPKDEEVQAAQWSVAAKMELENLINQYKTTPDAEQIISNADMIIDAITEMEIDMRTRTLVTKSIKIDSYLGGIPIGPVENRDVIYDYWEKIENNPKTGYANVENALSAYLKVAKDSPLKEYKSKALSYISEFNPVEIDMVEPVGRLFDYIISLDTLYRFAEKDRQKETAISDKDEGDVNAELGNLLISGYESDKGDVNYAPRTEGEGYSTVDPSFTDDIDDDKFAKFAEDTTQLDPLLAYYYSQGKVVAATNSGLEEIEQEVDGILEELERIGDDEDEEIELRLVMDNKVRKELDEIRNTIVSEQGPYFLPYTIMENSAFADSQGNTEVDKKDITDIVDFLDTVGNILYTLTPTFPSKGVKSNLGSSMEYTPTSKVMRLESSSGAPVEGDKGQQIDAEKLDEEERKLLKELLEAIDAYYFTPSYSGKSVIQAPEFLTSSGARKIMAGSANLGVQTLEGTAYEKLLDTKFTMRNIHTKRIYKFLNHITSGSIEIGSGLIREAEEAADALTYVFGNDTLNMNHMAKLLKAVHDETDTPLGEKKLDGMLISERAKQYDADYSSGKAMPLFLLPYYLEKHKGLIEREGMKRDAGRLKDLLRSVKTLPVMLKSLLKAHDVVRRIKGLEVKYGFRPLDIKNSEEVINKMYLEHNVDLAHSEIDTIVTEINSFSDIAKALGISEEVVYQVKAQFR